MTLYEIIKSIKEAKGSLNKQSIMDSHKENPLLKSYMRAVYDPAISYYQKKLSKDVDSWTGTKEFDQRDIDFMIDEIAARKVTGLAAFASLGGHSSALNKEGRELIKFILDRSIGASVGDTMTLKTWPGLFFTVPYQRCSLMDAKAKERFAKLKKFYVQTKADGSFAYLVKRLDGSVDVITRQGSTYPQEFAMRLCKDVPEGFVIVGELEVFERQQVEGWGEAGYLLDRKTGNGILNSALKDGDVDDKYVVKCVAWDMLTQEEFEAGKSSRPYSQRLDDFKISGYTSLTGNISLIPTWEVTSLEEAYKIYTEHTSRGLEGVIASDPDDLWKDGTSKGKIKLKLKFEAEYRCRGVIEGEGKAKGMVGAIQIETEDGLLECNCGTGFSDRQRQEFFDNPSLIVGEVVMLSANDIIQSRDTRKKPALSLPVFEEVRYDKKSQGANTLPEVIAILQAAKEGK